MENITKFIISLILRCPSFTFCWANFVSFDAGKVSTARTIYFVFYCNGTQISFRCFGAYKSWMFFRLISIVQYLTYLNMARNTTYVLLTDLKLLRCRKLWCKGVCHGSTMWKIVFFSNILIFILSKYVLVFMLVWTVWDCI